MSEEPPETLPAQDSSGDVPTLAPSLGDSPTLAADASGATLPGVSEGHPATGGPRRASGREPQEIPDHVGRYRVVGKLGAGGMGMVYAAHDDELDRNIAIKVLRSEIAGEAARDRLLREAQAMAKLSHANVIQVFDVGTIGDAIFVAMEMVEGSTLRKWMETSRGWREVVRVFSAAGAGLAAAHSAGLIHRDFKPDNVIVGDDGKVRVLDFGLARATEVHEPRSAPTELDMVSKLSEEITRAGAVMGTPGYMSLEQIEGVEADARTDQFAFCVSLYEALYGTRPFVGQNLGQIAYAILEQKLAEPVRDPGLPSRQRAAVLRGLAASPDDRWPNMDALLLELAHDPGRIRRRIVVGVLATGALAGAATIGGMRAEESPCTGAAEVIAPVWNEDRAAKVERALMDTKLAYAADTAKAVRENVDAYVDAWVEASGEACRATRVDGSQSEVLLDLRTTCLHGRKNDLDAILAELETADADVLEHARRMVSDLEPLEGCADIEALQAQDPLPTDPEKREAVLALDARASKLRALRHAGRYVKAVELGEELAAEAAAIDYPRLETHIHLWLTEAYDGNGQFAKAEEHARQGRDLAARARDDEMLARFWLQLLLAVGTRQARYDEALTVKDAARLAVQRIAPHPELEGLLEFYWGTAEYTASHYEAALTHYEAARQAWDGRSEIQPGSLAGLYTNLATASMALGRFDEARTAYDRAGEMWLENAGPDHPEYGNVQHNTGTLYYRTGKYEEAEPFLRRAIEIWEGSLGPDAGRIGKGLMMLASVQTQKKELDAARENYERAISVLQASFGQDHPEVGNAIMGLGSLEQSVGELEKAHETFERALAIYEEKLGPEHQYVAYPLITLAEMELDDGKPADALPRAERAVALFAKAGASDSPDGWRTRLTLARARLDTGDVDGADEELAKLFALAEAGSGDPAIEAGIEFHYARSRVAKHDRARARELAASAAKRYEELGSPELAAEARKISG